MKKINIKFLIIALILGIVLGTITEGALILNIEWLINITQSYKFWGIIMVIMSAIPKEYVNSTLGPLITMTVMTSTYYSIRLFMSGYTNIEAWRMFALLGITGAIYIGTFVYCIKEKIINKRVKNYIPKISLILMTIFSIVLNVIEVYGFYNRIFIFDNNAFMPTIIGIIVGIVLGIMLGKYFNKRTIINHNIN